MGQIDDFWTSFSVYFDSASQNSKNTENALQNFPKYAENALLKSQNLLKRLFKSPKIYWKCSPKVANLSQLIRIWDTLGLILTYLVGIRWKEEGIPRTWVLITNEISTCRTWMCSNEYWHWCTKRFGFNFSRHVKWSLDLTSRKSGKVWIVGCLAVSRLMSDR